MIGVLLVAWSLSACGSDATPPPDEAERTTFAQSDCATITVPTYAEVETGIFSICVHCHSASNTGAARNSAPDDVNFDTFAAAKASALRAVPMVRQRLMPPPDGSGPTNAQRNRLYEWAICGTPP